MPGGVFVPKAVLIEEAALEYPMSKRILATCGELGIPHDVIGAHNRIKAVPGLSAQRAFADAKSTLVVGVRRTLDFETCKPSANYQLPLATSCPGMCEYCYLQTTLGKRPYLRVYANVEEILARAGRYTEERAPQMTVFEGAATSDPVAVERYSGSLASAIGYFADQNSALFRFATKFTDIDTLLAVRHGGRTTIRFSINAAQIIREYEHATPPLQERLEAASRVAAAGYPIGFLVAPIFAYEGWKDQYASMLDELANALGAGATAHAHAHAHAVASEPMQALSPAPTFELISHRFTPRAKRNITDLFPSTTLPMDESQERRYKYGQFGYGKYVYSRELATEMEAFMRETIASRLPGAKVLYFV